MAAVATVEPQQLQPSLFGQGSPAFDHNFAGLQRHALSDGAWVDVQQNWLGGHQALFDTLVDKVAWRQHRRPMYDRIVDVPRLTGDRPARGPDTVIVDQMAASLSERYGTTFDRVGIALYRDGADSVAWHGDQVAREMPTALVATVSLGSPRPFCLRPKGGGSGGGATRRFHLGHGDLVVMGGTTQRTWDHAVPKVAGAGPRMAVMFRPAWAAGFSR